MTKPKLKKIRNTWICSCPIANGAGQSIKEAYKRWNENCRARSILVGAAVGLA